jgi:predicted ferric reductase
MSEMKPTSFKSKTAMRRLGWWAWALAVLVVGVAGAAYLSSPAGSQAAVFLNWLFSANSVQSMWYITRASGLIAYVLIWLSMVWGLGVASKIFDTLLHGTFTYDFHQYISLLAVGFTLLHIGVLLFDGYMPYSLWQILIPFISPYRPLWIGIGVIGFYLMLLVTVTFYIRTKIGMKAFRTIHVFSLVSYFAITLHSFMSGSDSSLPSVMVLYVVTFLITMFLIVYWLIMAAQKKLEKQASLKARLEKAKKQPQQPSMRPQQLSRPVHSDPYVPKNKNYSK